MSRRVYTETQLIRTLKLRRVTLEMLEQEKIVVPRIRGGERVYTEEQVEEIIFVRDLRREMGVNWAGVEVALQMRRNMKQMAKQMEEIFNYVRKRLTSERLDEDVSDY